MKDRRLVLDLETKKTFDEVGGREQMHQLGISVVGVYDYSTGQYRCYEESELGQLQNLLIDASLIIGFNHIGFDMPVLQPYLSVNVQELPLFDIMADFQKIVGHRIGLDSLALATLGVGKTGHGLDAIRFYREGRMAELKDYCLNDVKITKQLFDYGIQNGKIAFHSKFGNQRKEVEVDWKRYQKPASPKERQPAPAQYKLF
jgi:DEAD/DEAH box helicase domain-containing protein